MKPRFSLQTFTIRKFLKRKEDFDATFARVRASGLGALELARINFKEDEIAAVSAAAKRHDVEIGSSQITFDYLDKNRDWVLDLHERLDCQFTAVSVLPMGAIFGGRDKLLAFAEKLDKLGQYYRERGLNLLFHHHDFEFKHYGEDLGLDLILNATQSENVGLVMDTYWVQRGGKSPQDLIADLNGRVKVVHLRDFRIRWKLFDLLPKDAELGAGNLDFKRIIDSAVANGVHYMAIEQDSPEPFRSIDSSVNHLHALGYKDLF